MAMASLTDKILSWSESVCKDISGNGGQLINLNGAIYYCGLHGILFENIESSEKWEEMPNIGVWECGSGVCNGKLVVVGGKNLTVSSRKDVLFFQEDRRKWVSGKQMIEGCGHPTVISISSGLIVMEPKPDGGGLVQVFNSDEDKWYYGRQLPITCTEISSASHNNDFVFINQRKLVWCSSIKDLIDSNPSENWKWNELKETPHSNAELCIFNGVLLAVGGQGIPQNYASVYAYHFPDGRWSLISTMSRVCCSNDIAAIEIPETQQLLLVQASKRLMMKCRVRDYDDFMTYKICPHLSWSEDKNNARMAENTVDLNQMQKSIERLESCATKLIQTHIESLQSLSQISKQPTMPTLICFSDKKLNIASRIGPHYKKFGILLLNDEFGNITSSSESKHMKDAEQINIDILQQWLEGKGKQPVTWTTLVTVLRQIEMNTLADYIENKVLKETIETEQNTGPQQNTFDFSEEDQTKEEIMSLLSTISGKLYNDSGDVKLDKASNE